MDWSTEYAAALTIMLPLAATSLLIILFKMKWRSGDEYPPVAATMLDHILNFKRLHHFLLDLHRRYRTFSVAYPTFNLVCTTDPADVEHVLKTNFANYVKGTSIHDVMEDLLGDGIFNVDGEQWRQQRKLSSLEFSAKILRDFSSVVFRENALKLSKILLQVHRTNQTIEMQGLLMRSTMDAICKVGFGVEINSLSNINSGAESAFAKAFDNANSTLFRRHFDPFWKLKRYFNLGSEVTIKKSIKTVDDFVYNVIQSRRQEISLQNINEKPDLLSRFMAVTEKNPDNYSDKYLRDIVTNFMIAGRDTNAITLSWFLYLLCRNLDVEKKLLQEIHDVVGADQNDCVSVEESISSFSGSLTHTVLDKMQYLHAALTETLRLYPPIPVDGKYAVSDDILPDGYKIRKGDNVSYVSYSMGRMKYLWGSDAEEFRPERWIHDGIFQPQSPFKFTAFQAGPRLCLGKDFAYMQVKTVAAVLVRFFKFEVAQCKEVTYAPTQTLQMTGDGLNLHVKSRLIL